MKDRNKPKFDKQKCIKCMYHCNLTGGFRAKIGDKNYVSIVCDYATINRQTCLINTSEGTIDLRGEDYNDCKLFKEGAVEKKNWDLNI